MKVPYETTPTRPSHQVTTTISSQRLAGCTIRVAARPMAFSFITIWILVANSLALERTSESTSTSQECGVYLAESTIPNAGLGMFAGTKPYQKGDYVSFGDIVIPVSELDWHMSESEGDYTFLWNDYVWSASMFTSMDQEVDDAEELLHACSPGFGAAVNCVLPLVNVKDYEEGVEVDNAGLSSQNPGVGAFTPYHDRKFVASRNIEPGMEFFASYGEKYFASRAAYATVPLSKHYKKADKLLQRFNSLSRNMTGANLDTALTSLSRTPKASLLTSLWQTIADFPHVTEDGLRTLSAIPSNATDIVKTLQSGGTAKQFYNESIRSLEWLEQNGQCMDNIRDGISSIPSAGRGAFATRSIPKDSLVAPMPLIQVHRNLLTMYSVHHKQPNIPDPSKPIHRQLLLNYCFGHRQSNLLLCPYGLLTSLINHSTEPNARIRWSSRMGHPEWRDQALKHWVKNGTGLIFDVVALRDITEGEEVTISYGDEWEEAWQSHLEDFETQRQPDYQPAFELNRRIELRVKSTDEWSYEQEGIYVYCRKLVIENFGMTVDYESETFEWHEPVYPCRVRYRWDDDTYTVEVFNREFNIKATEQEKSMDTVGAILFSAPRDIFCFFDAPYERDHHMEWSFRHDMRIPDEMFPSAWMNVPLIPLRDLTDEQ